MTRFLRSWVIATTVAFAAVFALGNAAYASDPVEVNDNELRDKLFVAAARMHTPGAQGLKDLALSAELYAFRQLNPNATVQQLNEHAAVVRQWFDSQLTATDMTRQAYELYPRMLNLLALVPGGAVSAPVMKEIYEMAIAPQGKAYGERMDQVATAQFSYDVFHRLYPIQDRIWRYVTTRAQADPAFAEAWDGSFGVRLGVMSTASVDQLSADPMIAVYMNVDAILEHQNNLQNYLTMTREQINANIGRLQGQNDHMIGLIGQLNTQYPLVSNGPKPTAVVHQQQRDAAAERQRIIDGAGTAIDVLGTLIGYADARSGRIVKGVGKSAMQIATAINKYIPSIAGMGLTQVLTSMSTVALTGNIIGAIGALLPVFADSPSMDQLMMAEMRRLRQDIAHLNTNMNGRFDRVENALTNIYTTMTGKLDEVLALQNVTIAKLAAIEKSLYELNTTINNWGAVLLETWRQDELNDAKDIINRWVGHTHTYGEPIPLYSDYATAESKMLTFAAQRAFTTPFTVPDIESYPGRNPVSTIREFKTKGAVHYLDWYARQHLGWAEQPAISGPADPTAWVVAARAYARLVVENPDYAKRVVPDRAATVLGVGQGILDASASLSRPLATPDANGNRTNAIFTNLLSEYRNATQDFAAQLGFLRGAHPDGKPYNMFGTAAQPIPAQAHMSDTAAIPPCAAQNGGGYQLTRPEKTSITGTPHEILFAQYVHPIRPKARLCYRANFVNVEQSEDYKWQRTFADLNVTIEIVVNWNGWEPVFRSWTQTYPLGEVCKRYVTGAPGGFCFDERYYLERNWNSTYLPAFQAGAPESTAWNLRDWVRDRANEWLSGKQKSYYDRVVAELDAVGSPLFQHNARMHKATQLLQAYTRIGWAGALHHDELLSLQTFGPERLPADWSDMPVISGSFNRAKVNYGGCVLNSGRWPVADACGEGQRDYSALTGQSVIPATCSPGTPAGASGDPVGDCILALSAARVSALAARYEFHSRNLAGGVYEEGMPDVRAVLDELSLAETFIRRLPVS